MNRVCSPYFDPDYDNLPERIHGPAFRVNDNESLEDCTIVKIDCVNKQSLLLDVVQALTDLNLTISKGYISSDAGWFMDVFHVKNELGFKVTDQRVISYIQQAMSSGNASSPKAKATSSLAIEMTGKDRPGLFSEISAALAGMGCNIIEAHTWSHNALLACVAYISGQSVDTPIDDRRLHAIEDHLTTVLRATTATEESAEVKPAAGLPLPKGELGSTTRVERRPHQLMLEVCDFDSPSASLTCIMINNILFDLMLDVCMMDTFSM
ncbi:ACT domain-containing protein ACR2-like isoform X2 [Salvia miltiorrhiza]|uniref:ACT domain-containing protein ACR2-like isoform X2 n=1 Tax=Salvia miltiorrhiza TaxID=226208 RepID=UPI0025AB8F1F|nr:ACT domain-containing protein ACR2-like isoform X2 [Salvia miltiorrhiza]